VPQQKILDGRLKIEVVEGYIAKVDLEDDAPAPSYPVRETMSDLQDRRPAKASDLESALLRLNDLPGLSFRAVLSPLSDPGQEGGVMLTLIPERKQGGGQISFDNFGSRFLGPYETSLTYAASFLPLQQTVMSVITSLPFRELQNAAIDHTIALTPSLSVHFNGGLTHAEPGDTLKLFEIDSRSRTLGGTLTWQWVRQRENNFSVLAGVDGRNTDTDILGTALTRDRIRCLRLGISYDSSDSWQGENVLSLTLGHGLSILGASKKGELNVSRAGAAPDFSKTSLTVSRLQHISPAWNILASGAAQIASAPLYSAEQFGYGGAAFGRAYDSSEITGDEGAEGSFELRYIALDPGPDMTVVPFGFYDIGMVQAKLDSVAGRESGTSAGVGLRFSTKSGFSGNAALAFPLTRAEDAPIYGDNGAAPRFMLQLSYAFAGF
jgi:hemolysin activation/secretion protein